MKFYAARVSDLEDLDTIRPTAEERAFAYAQLPRIARFDPAGAYRMQLYLDQSSTPQPPPPPRPPGHDRGYKR
jgi:hypothetical protein